MEEMVEKNFIIKQVTPAKNYLILVYSRIKIRPFLNSTM